MNDHEIKYGRGSTDKSESSNKVSKIGQPHVFDEVLDTSPATVTHFGFSAP